MQQIKPAIDHETAKRLAREYIENTFSGYAYPIIPTNDYGIPEPYSDVGCLPWVCCTSVTIDTVYIEDEQLDPNGDLIVYVDVFTTWSRDDEGDEDDEVEPGVQATYEVVVGYEDGKLVCFDYERVD